MIRLPLLLLTLSIVTGCAGVVTATRDDPLAVDHGSRTLGSTLDDQLIETRASVNIAKAHVDLERDARVTVTSFNGVVLLAGQVPREELRTLAAQTAAEIQRVKVVHNELTVGPNISLLARNNDALITTNAKTRLLADRSIPGRRIKVTTEAGVVYLMGLVRRNEAELAVQAVQQVGGIQRIVKLFEYID